VPRTREWSTTAIRTNWRSVARLGGDIDQTDGHLGGGVARAGVAPVSGRSPLLVPGRPRYPGPVPATAHGRRSVDSCDVRSHRARAHRRSTSITAPSISATRCAVVSGSALICREITCQRQSIQA
jgi:hypothetical protein